MSASEINETQTLSLASDNGVSVAEDSNVLSANGNDSELLSADSGNLLGESNGNSPDLLGADAGTFADLQTRINSAQPWDTITLDRDYIGSGTIITIVKNSANERLAFLTIDGNGHTLDAQSRSCIMGIDVNNVVLKNIHFINGYDYGTKDSGSQRGGSLYFLTSAYNCSVINCTFTNSKNWKLYESCCRSYSYFFR